MKALKDIIDQHSASELAEVIFREMSHYHVQKLLKAIEKADIMLNKHDYEDKKAQIIPSEKIEFGTGEGIMWFRGQTENVHIDFRTKEEKLIQYEIEELGRVGKSVEFEVEGSGTVKLIVRDKANHVNSITKAVCHPSDTFDLNIGKLIALYKANYNTDWKLRLINEGFGHLFHIKFF